MTSLGAGPPTTTTTVVQAHEVVARPGRPAPSVLAVLGDHDARLAGRRAQARTVPARSRTPVLPASTATATAPTVTLAVPTAPTAVPFLVGLTPRAEGFTGEGSLRGLEVVRFRRHSTALLLLLLLCQGRSLRARR